MSTSATPVDEAALVEAVLRVRSDLPRADRRAWLIVGHVDGNPNHLELVHQGEDLADFAHRLVDDQVMYCFLRLTATFDMSTTVKFIYVRWVGENVPAMKRGRYGVVQGSVQQYFVPFHLQLETSSVDELSEEALVQKLDEGSGTLSKVLEGPIDNRQKRGFTQFSYQRASHDKSEVKSVAPAGAVVQITDQLQAAIAEVRDDSNPMIWVVSGYEEGNLKKPLTLVASGTGGIEELKEHLEDDQVHYGLFRTSDRYDDIATVKFVYLYWVGEKVKPLLRGKVSAYAGPVEKLFSPAHVTLSFTNRHDISEKVISDKVTSSSGSKSWVK